jgi:hypothetical protein
VIPDTFKALVEFIGLALLHAGLRVAAHGVKDRLTGFINRPERLRNKDVRTAIERALTTTVRKLKSEYKKQCPKDAAASAAFDALKNLKLDGVADSEAAEPDIWLSAEHVSESIRHILDDLPPGTSSGLRRFLEERFPPLFVFAFREIGLKNDTKVRAVIFESMLRRLDDSNRALHSLLVNGDEALPGKLQEVERDMLRRIEDSDRKLQALIVSSDGALQQGLEDLGYNASSYQRLVDQLLDEIRGLRVAVNSEHLGDGPVVAYVRVDDPEGKTLRTEPIRTKTFSIGRGSRVAINLDAAKVSRVHAVVVVNDSGVWVQNRSANGTSLQGEKIFDRRHVDFGTAIEIQSFHLYVLRPDASAEQLLTPATDRDQ